MAGNLVDALRIPLAQVVGDADNDLASAGELGAELRDAFDRLGKGNGFSAPLLAWRRTLDNFESMSPVARAACAAQGLRLVRGVIVSGGAGGNEPPLAQSPRTLKGIGPALAESLADRGLETLEDMAWFLPKRYDDVRSLTALGEALKNAATGDRVTVKGKVARCRFFRRGRRRWIDMRMHDPEEKTSELVVRWFNANPGMAKRFPAKTLATISGRLTRRDGNCEMANPDVLEVIGPDGAVVRRAEPIIARYPDVAGVPPATMRKATAAALVRVQEHLVDAVPVEVAERQGLAPLADSLSVLHGPPETLSTDEVRALNEGSSAWHRRLAFDEFFVLGLAVARRRQRRRDYQAKPFATSPGLMESFATSLPYRLTGAQQRSLSAIGADLCGEQPMNRLLQGDVGSGKTAVALGAAFQVVRGGGQVALMAPTALLAEQHHRSLTAFGDALGLRIALLTAATPRPVRESLLSLLAAGATDMVVGTHALLADRVQFAGLGLAIIDEQHRFGVAQRVRLRRKGTDAAPHLLVMTATPIPRTLALTAYGDLDVTALDEMPPGRLPVATQVLTATAGRKRAYRKVAERIAAGERAYVVCPLVEPSEADDGRAKWADATSTASELDGMFPDISVGLVHGRLTADQRERVMRAFREGEVQLLVSTTVVEVGVDVPEATVMVIEDAQHFGLSQLHQLRGRVGRGGGQAHCLLLTRGRKTPDAEKRLAVMAETTDGFRIAEADLEIRGPGEVLGTRQAGLPKLRFGDLRQHGELLAAAREEADRVYAEDPELSLPKHAGAQQVMSIRADEREYYGAEGG